MGISYADYIRGEKKIETPNYKCRSCHNCKDGRCSVFNRHVIPNLHRCFYHTMYKPNSMVYTTPEYIREMSRIGDTQ